MFQLQDVAAGRDGTTSKKARSIWGAFSFAQYDAFHAHQSTLSYPQLVFSKRFASKLS